MKRIETIVRIEDTIINPNILNILSKSQKIIESKKIITADIKNQLIALGFKEVVIGCKKDHEITSKQVKIDFHGFDIAIGLSPVAINYGCGRRYRSMVIKLKEQMED